MTVPPTALENVATKPPKIDVAEVARAVDEQFALAGEYTPLVSERDQNFQLTTVAGERFVVKVTSAGEQSVVSDFHVAALLHLQADNTVQAPRVVHTSAGQVSGHIENDGHACVLRVVSFLDGTQLAAVTIDTDLVRDFGGSLARLDRALQGFSHPGESPVLLWDLQRVIELRELRQYIDSASVAEAVMQAIDDFEYNVLPRMGSMRRQVIHGDANPENVLLDESSRRVSGFIDISDSINAPIVFEPAIAASYLRADGADALEFIAPFLASYQEVLPLRDDELEMLFDLVRGRLATTIAILFWRLGARSKDDPYREKTLRMEGGAVQFLASLDRLGRDAFAARLSRETG